MKKIETFFIVLKEFVAVPVSVRKSRTLSIGSGLRKTFVGISDCKN
jgi:hypothetical protein